MKISTFVMFLVVIGGVFWMFSAMVGEANVMYPEAKINDSEWSTKYDLSNEINATVTPLQQKFEIIQDENQGFFTKLAAGITAIPYAVILVPEATFKSMVIAGKIITGFFEALGIPSKLLLLVILILVIWGVFKLLEFFQRVPV